MTPGELEELKAAVLTRVLEELGDAGDLLRKLTDDVAKSDAGTSFSELSEATAVLRQQAAALQAAVNERWPAMSSRRRH